MEKVIGGFFLSKGLKKDKEKKRHENKVAPQETSVPAEVSKEKKHKDKKLKEKLSNENLFKDDEVKARSAKSHRASATALFRDHKTAKKGHKVKKAAAFDT